MKNLKKIKYLFSIVILLLFVNLYVLNNLIKVNSISTSIQEDNLNNSATAFSDDFESGLSKWQNITGLWHLTDTGSSWPNPCHSSTHSMWFGNETTGNYETSFQEYGEMISVPFSLVGYTLATLEFYQWREGEGSGYDISYIDISTNGINWNNVYTNGDDYIAPWQHIFLDISGYVGNPSVQLRFRFDTIDHIANYYRGWLVDDIQVSDTPDDNYEENDYYYNAYNISSHENTWISTIDGSGVLLDDDWYKIYINPGDQRLLLDLTFTHADGNIDIEVYNSGLFLLTGGYSTTDNEHIDYVVPSGGTYYIFIFGPASENTYDLRWDDTPGVPLDDNYEENDVDGSAYNLSGYENIWLNTINGSGVQLDDDWFEIYVDPGELFLSVDLIYTAVDGDIDIKIYNSSLDFVIGSITSTDNEYIDYAVPSYGTYYILILGINVGNSYDLLWDDNVVPPDDNYEENDVNTQPYNLSLYEATWLSSVNGSGVQFDPDWYEIYIDPGDEHVIVKVTFTHIDGNIDIGLFNSSLSLLTYNISTTDNEIIDYIVPSSGVHFLLVTGENRGNKYDLWWDDLSSTDDNYEENDAYTSAFDLSTHKNTWLRNVDDYGVQMDEDWYEISIDPGYEQLIVDLIFDHTADDLDLEIYDSSGTIVIGSTSSTDNERINYVLPSAGIYYIRVFGNNIGNEYDLRWNSITPEEIPGYNLFSLFGVIITIGIVYMIKVGKRKTNQYKK
ncbi:MAG: pre-peptidase C-terminal domain-containing protein [Candidatus Hermodarchaeota archaeon]